MDLLFLAVAGEFRAPEWHVWARNPDALDRMMKRERVELCWSGPSPATAARFNADRRLRMAARGP